MHGCVHGSMRACRSALRRPKAATDQRQGDAASSPPPPPPTQVPTMSSGSTSTGSYPSLYLVTICRQVQREAERAHCRGCTSARSRAQWQQCGGKGTPLSSFRDRVCHECMSPETASWPICLTLRPRDPCGRYESRFTQCMQSMCTAELHGVAGGDGGHPLVCLSVCFAAAGIWGFFGKAHPAHRPQGSSHHPPPEQNRTEQSCLLSVSLVLRLHRNPISACMSNPCFAARVSMNGQSKKSPLYVTKMEGLTWCGCVCECVGV